MADIAHLPKLKAGGTISGIVPTSIEEVFRLAQAVHKSGMAPKELNSPEKITIAVMHGLEIGLPPMQSLQRISVINGRPTLWGDALPALLWSRGFSLTETLIGDGDDRVAWCGVQRPDKTTMIERRFSVADAKQAGLWGKVGPWKQYPDRMLQMRARAYACRDGAADVLAGLYVREEIEDADATAPKSAYRARKDGDYERLVEGIRSCATEADLDTYLSNSKDALDNLPRSWAEHVDEAVAAMRAKLSAIEVEPEVEPQQTDTEAARESIRTAVSLQMLAHLRDVYPDADWADLESDYDNKAHELGAA